ncbi:MAG TPA: hypothetical protein VMF08_10510 [Candidatus Sulfotelmatobacter sp.]|nr:hypothetical protein [Candidatus Sulfotelmatobacter sp.]
MKTASTAPTRRFAVAFPLFLAVLLAALFWKSFLPGYVHFSNDGPLGQQNTAWSQFPGTLTGIWVDLNDIGQSGATASLGVTSFASWFLGPVGYSKFYPPIVLFILGIGAWTFFRQLKLSPLASTLGALAIALNSCYFGNACWGTCPQEVAIGMVFFALALAMANSGETRPLIYWSRLALAGLAVGVSIIEGLDNGAILSVFVAAYVFFAALIEEGAPILTKIWRGIGRVAIVAVFAAFISVQTLIAVFGTFISGGSGAGPNQIAETPLEHWDWATEWSIPKKETLGILVPGLFGYKMDTPKDMMNSLTNSYVGGEYWGGVGRTPAIDRYFDSGSQGPVPPGIMRMGYGGFYCGTLVALIALFAMVRSMQRENSIFSKTERNFIWFCIAAMVVSLLLAWGRFGPFNGWPYRWLYALPGASVLRNPGKFIVIFYLAMAIIFAYGIDALSRVYLSTPDGKPISPIAQFKNWLTNARGFDHKWSLFCIFGFAAAFLAWMTYAAQTGPLTDYLQTVGFDAGSAKQIAKFSIGQAGFFLLILATAVVFMILVLAGVFSGRLANLGRFLLGALLVLDMSRANLPWIVHWNYKQKYESNPIIDLLRDKPYEHRVADIPSGSPFDGLYQIEWMQHHFPYYNIQCLDKIQQPRMPADLTAYEMTIQPTGPQTAYLLTRRWQLTNTRYLLGPANFLDQINDQLDPGQRRFRILQRFSIALKPGVEEYTEAEQLTAVPDNNGDYALFEFTGALPRASLYSNWQVNTNDNATLQHLAARSFDPLKTVLVSTVIPNEPLTNSADEDAGTVEYKSYAPRETVLDAEARTPSVLLLNDKFDPNWRVFVDGKPAELLRCNFIMRGVFLAPGSHTVEFKFSLPHKPLYITIVAVGTGIGLCTILLMSGRKSPLTAISKTKKDENPQAVTNRPQNQGVRQTAR